MSEPTFSDRELDGYRTGGTHRTLTAWRTATGNDQGSVTGTASGRFVDAAAGDYRLRAGAVAIDMGLAGFNSKVAPTADYKDRVTERPVAKVTTGQIYWGAVPFVVIQVIMVGLVIAFPGLVSRDLATGPKVDVDKAFQQMRQDGGGRSGAGGAPSSPESAASGSASGAASADDDMTKLLLESIKRDSEPKR